ncbi:unnamed protein product, partial [Mesorhabditis belari]|uniref:Tudor domain-containing protein n=1 Tax=Mesorhabditis belari TaxID=2138241 RepID=A0AAF3EKJ5_9BILA
MHDDFGARLGTTGNWSSWHAGGDLPALNIPAQVNDYIDVAIASVSSPSLLEVRLLSAKYSFEWIHHELSVTENFKPLLNARKNDLAVTSIGDTWYRAIVLKRETASEVLVHLLDEGDEERVDFRALYKMPSSITHVPPLAFPLCVPESLWVGIRKEDLHHELANVKLTFRLENTRNSCFTGNDFQVYDEETGALKSLKEALQQRTKLDRVNYVLAQKINHKSMELPSFPTFTSATRNQMNKRQMKRLGQEPFNQGHEDPTTRLPTSTNITIIEPSSEGLSVGAIVAICISSVLSFLLLLLASALCFHFLKKQKWRKLFGKRFRDEEKATVESREDMESERKEDTERETRVAAGHSATILRQKALPPLSKQTELNSSQPSPQPAQQIAMVADSATAITPLDQVSRGEPEEERGSDNPPPIHHEEKVAKLDPQIIGRIGTLMALGKMRSADDKNHRKSSRSVDPTQISSTRPSLCLSDRQLERNQKSALTTPNPTMKSITSIRNTSESVSSRPKHRQQSDQHKNGSSLLVSPAMQTTQRESDSTSAKRKLKEEASMRTAIAKTDSTLSMAKRLGAGREQGVWEENSTIDEEEETDDKKIPDYLMLGVEKELYYGTTFDNPSKPSSHRSSQPMSIHESDLEPPHFTHIKQILGAPASPPITWALTPPSDFCLSDRSDAISKMKMASAPQLVQQQSLERSRSKGFEYEVLTDDKIRVNEPMDFTTTHSGGPITAILSPVLDESKDHNTKEKITSKLSPIDADLQSSSFHSAMSEGVNDY